jgi:SepF-like predicted cell division protein (DUF552 family)
MGLMRSILGGHSRTTEDYVEIDLDEVEAPSGEAGTQVQFAEIDGQRDVIAIKDAVYDGNIVVADITRLRTTDQTVEHITEELKQVAREVNGDIVQRGDDQLVITPSGVGINREKLNR